jgi:antibiotic biosynthesis monooxygenase (ABM) superfamily enzyme
MAVRILLKRWVPAEKEKDLVGLITELRSMASRQPGYISGETMRERQEPR